MSARITFLLKVLLLLEHELTECGNYAVSASTSPVCGRMEKLNTFFMCVWIKGWIGCMHASSDPNKTLIQNHCFTKEPFKAQRTSVNYTRMLSGRAESTLRFPIAYMISEPKKRH